MNSSRQNPKLSFSQIAPHWHKLHSDKNNHVDAKTAEEVEFHVTAEILEISRD